MEKLEAIRPRSTQRYDLPRAAPRGIRQNQETKIRQAKGNCEKTEEREQ